MQVVSNNLIDSIKTGVIETKYSRVDQVKFTVDSP